MAENYTHPQMYYCSQNHHDKSETMNTDEYRVMCRGHVPVFLFESFTDKAFVKYHYDISTIHFLLKFYNNPSVYLLKNNKPRVNFLKEIFSLKPLGILSGKPFNTHNFQVYMLWSKIQLSRSTRYIT